MSVGQIEVICHDEIRLYWGEAGGSHDTMKRVGGKWRHVDGETGLLVPLEQMSESPFEPLQPEKVSRDLAAPINELMRDSGLRERFGQAGRRWAEETFSWSAIAEPARSLYCSLSKA